MKPKKARQITREIMKEHDNAKRLPYLTESWIERLPIIGRFIYHNRMTRNALLLNDYMQSLKDTGKVFAKKIQRELRNGR